MVRWHRDMKWFFSNRAAPEDAIVHGRAWKARRRQHAVLPSQHAEPFQLWIRFQAPAPKSSPPADSGEGDPEEERDKRMRNSLEQTVHVGALAEAAPVQGAFSIGVRGIRLGFKQSPCLGQLNLARVPIEEFDPKFLLEQSHSSGQPKSRSSEFFGSSPKAAFLNNDGDE
jgi:hypothetical protein